MPIVDCRECGSKVSTEARTCPSCGAKARKQMSTGAAFTIVGLSIALFYVVAHQSEWDAQTEAARVAAQTPAQRASEIRVADLNGARTACRELVKNNLHDPDSSEFDDYGTWYASEKTPGNFEVFVTLRAKNGFGGLRHFSVDCRVRLSNGNWIGSQLKELPIA